MAVDAFGVEPNWLTFDRVEVPIQGLAPEFDGYRIAVLSDFHLPNKSKRWLVEKACRLAVDFRPDLIAAPGDFVHNRKFGVPDFSGYFDALKAPDGVWGTLGNHDHWTDEKAVRRQLQEHSPIRTIENEHRLIKRGKASLAVGGIGDLWCGFVNVKKAFDGVAPDVPRILLSHNPDFAEDMTADERVDLQLSGHTHGGEIRIPFGPAPVIPSKYGNKFRAGLCEGKRHRVYVTRGICTVAARFFCPPQVSGLILRPA